MNLVRLEGDAAIRINRATEADPDRECSTSAQEGMLPEPVGGFEDLLENPSSPFLGPDRPAFEGEDRAITPAQAKLELRPADLDPEEQGGIH